MSPSVSLEWGLHDSEHVHAGHCTLRFHRMSIHRDVKLRFMRGRLFCVGVYKSEWGRVAGEWGLAMGMDTYWRDPPSWRMWIRRVGEGTERGRVP